MTIETQRLLLQLAYVDGLVDDLLDRLEQQGLWDEALVIVSADHGQGLTPGQTTRRLDAGNAADLAYVPLFVRTPGQPKGAVDERNAMAVDLLPTVADVLDVDLPFAVEGVSLLGPPRSGAKVWYDDPGRPITVDAGQFGPVARTGLAPDLVRPDRGIDGLFALGPHGDLVGTAVGAAGPPSPVVATSQHPLGWESVDRDSGRVPAMLWGELDRSPGTSWLAIGVNGTVAGTAYAAERDGQWYFAGLAADRYFTQGANDVVLYAVDGATLRPLRWR